MLSGRPWTDGARGKIRNNTHILVIGEQTGANIVTNSIDISEWKLSPKLSPLLGKVVCGGYAGGSLQVRKH